MFVSLYNQTEQFFFSAILGIVIMVIYDIFRISRCFLTPSKLLSVVLDIIFWVASLILTFLFVATISGGFIRWFVVIGAFLGGAFYRITLSNFVYREFIRFIKFVLLCIRKIKMKGQSIKDEKKGI